MIRKILALGAVLLGGFFVPASSQTFPGSALPNLSGNVEGTGIAGLDNAQWFIYGAPTTAAPMSTFRVDRNVSYTGGTPGNVNDAIFVLNTVGANVANFEWSILGELNNSATAGQNVAVVGYANTKTTSTSITWGGTFVVDDNTNTANPANGRVGTEIDNLGNGTDTSTQRIILDLVGGKHAGTGTTPTITWGWRVGAQSGTLANATFVHGGYYNPATYTDLLATNSGISTTNGIDFSSGTFSGSPFKSSGFAVDASGNLTANNVTTAWTAFTPTPTCGTATFTVNSARSRTVGKTTYAQIDFTITAIGTCTSPITFTLPNTANSSGSISGQDIGSGNNGVFCLVAAASTTATCIKNAAVAYLVNSHVVASGVYENQ